MNTVFNIKPVRRGRTTERERIHEFLEREGRPEAAQIRDWIEHWYNRLPREKQSDIRGRLRSGETDRFTEAYFELQMFALLKTSRHQVCVEPALSNGRYKPDFLAIRGSRAFYFEATVCGQGEHNAGLLHANANENDAVEKVRSALREEEVHMHSHLWLRAEGNLDRTLSKRTIGKPFIDLLKRTSAEEVEESCKSGLSLQEVFQLRRLVTTRRPGPETLQGRYWTRMGTSPVGSGRCLRCDPHQPRQEGDRVEKEGTRRGRDPRDCPIGLPQSVFLE